MRTLFGLICGTMRGPFGGINAEAIHPVHSRFQGLWRRQLAIRPQLEMHQGIRQNRREVMQGCMRFRARHRKLCPEYLTGRIGLGVIEDAQQFVGHGGQCAVATTAWFAPARSGRDPFFIRVLLRGLGDVAEDRQQVVELGLGQAGEGFHLPLVSDLHSHWSPSSLAFWRTAYLILYWGTTLMIRFLSKAMI
jgi:hypothetical protein